MRIHGAPQDLERFVIKMRKVYRPCKGRGIRQPADIRDHASIFLSAHFFVINYVLLVILRVWFSGRTRPCQG